MYHHPHQSSSSVLLCSSSSSLPSLADQSQSADFSVINSPQTSTPPSPPAMADNYDINLLMRNTELYCSTTTTASSSNNDQLSSSCSSAAAADQHVMMTSLGMAATNKSPPFPPLQLINPCYRQIPQHYASSNAKVNGKTQQNDDTQRQNHWHRLNVSHSKGRRMEEGETEEQPNINIGQGHLCTKHHSVVVLPAISSPKPHQQKSKGTPKVLANKRMICVQTVENGHGSHHHQRSMQSSPTIISPNTDPSADSAEGRSLNNNDHLDHFLRVASMNVAVLDWLHCASLSKLGELCEQFSTTVSDSNWWTRRLRNVVRQIKGKTHLSSFGSFASTVADVSPCTSLSKPSLLYGLPLCSVVPFTADASPMPRFVYDIMEWLECQAQTSDGIFRKSGASVRIKEISEVCSSLSADQPIPAHLLADSSPYDVADALKQYFASLPGSLMTEQISEIVVKMVGELPEQWHFVALHHCVLLLPTEHREALMQLLRFLCTITRKSSRMSSLCMATCWMPTLFKMPGENTSKRGGTHRQKETTALDNNKRGKLMRSRTICAPVLDSLDAVKRVLVTMIDQWERLLHLPNALAKVVSGDKRWKVCHDLEMPMKNGQFDFSKELQTNFKQQLSRLREEYLSSASRWENRGLKRVFPDGSQLFTRTINDMVLLKAISVQTAIAASPNLVLAAILHNRHLWDSQVKECQRIGPSLQNLDIVKVTYKTLLGNEPEKSAFMARCWHYSDFNDNVNSSTNNNSVGIGLLVERSVVPRNVCRHNAENEHISVYKSEFLVVPVCSGYSYVIHISRADFRGKSSDWYDKVYGDLLVQNLRRLRQLIQSQQNGCFRRGTIV